MARPATDGSVIEEVKYGKEIPLVSEQGTEVSIILKLYLLTLKHSHASIWYDLILYTDNAGFIDHAWPDWRYQ